MKQQDGLTNNAKGMDNASGETRTGSSLRSGDGHFVPSCYLSGKENFLLKFVKSPDGVFVFDVNEKLPHAKGRENFFYIKADHKLVKQAHAEGKFGPLDIDADALIGKIRHQLYIHLYQQIGMARKSGECVGGYAKIHSLFQSHKLSYMILTEDCTGQDLLSIYKQLPRNRTARIGHSDKMGEIFNKEKTMSVGFMKDHFLKAIKNDLTRLQDLSST